MWRYDTKCKYMFILSLKNLARKGLKQDPMELISSWAAGISDTHFSDISLWLYVWHICLCIYSTIGPSLLQWIKDMQHRALFSVINYSVVTMTFMSSQITCTRLCKRLFKLTSKKTSKAASLALCEGNPLMIGWFPSQRASNPEMFLFQFDDVTMKNEPTNNKETDGLRSHAFCRAFFL